MQTTSTQTAPALTSGNLKIFAATVPGKIVLGFAATLVVAAAAHISFPLPFTLVPLTLQPLAVLGVGLALGPVAGFFTMLAYLAEGALGLPVFSPHGPGGVAQLIGPTGGYLMSYPFVAAITGGFTRALQSRMRSFAAAALACTAAVILLYTFGAGWLLTLAHLPLRAAWVQGVLPFLPGEIVKVFAAAGIYSALARPHRA